MKVGLFLFISSGVQIETFLIFIHRLLID